MKGHNKAQKAEVEEPQDSPPLPPKKKQKKKRKKISAHKGLSYPKFCQNLVCTIICVLLSHLFV